MSAATDTFKKGISAFKAGNTLQALRHFSQAIKSGMDDATVYDSRAAVLEKLGRHKEALADSKRVIELKPDRWQGYSRSARLFLNIEKFNAAQTMADMALRKLRPEDGPRREELNLLVQRISNARDAVVQHKLEQKAKSVYHFGSLPVEIATTIFRITLEDNSSYVVVLAQVCQHWRSAILNISSFWGTLYLTSRHPERKARLWLARCKDRLEALHLLGKQDNIMLSLQELRSASFDRLRDLTIGNLSMDSVRSALPSLTPSVISKLHSIRLVDMTLTVDQFWLWEPEDLQLRCVDVQGSPVDWPALSQHCVHLRNLSFRGPLDIRNWCDVLWLLHANSHLQVLSFTTTAGSLPVHLAPIRDLSEALPACITLPHLTDLALGGPGLNTLDLLQRVSPEALQTLRFERCSTMGSLTTISMGPGAKSLQELRITQCLTESFELIQLLRQARSLRIFHLQHFHATNQVAEALASSSELPSRPPRELDDTSETPDIICPALTEIDFSHSCDLKSGPVIRLVKGRLAGTPPVSDISAPEAQITVSPITSIVLDDCPGIDANILPWLRNAVSLVSCVYMTRKEAKRKR